MNELLYYINEGDKWAAAQGEEEEKPSFLLYRPNLLPFVSDGRYIKMMTLVWNYNVTNDSMLPNEFQIEEMKLVEERLANDLESDVQAVLAFSITGNGRKEWVWYSTDIEETRSRVKEALAAFNELPIEMSDEHDPKWIAYFEILDAIEFDQNELQNEGGDFDAL